MLAILLSCCGSIQFTNYPSSFWCLAAARHFIWWWLACLFSTMDIRYIWTSHSKQYLLVFDIIKTITNDFFMHDLLTVIDSGKETCFPTLLPFLHPTRRQNFGKHADNPKRSKRHIILCFQKVGIQISIQWWQQQQLYFVVSQDNNNNNRKVGEWALTFDCSWKAFFLIVRIARNSNHASRIHFSHIHPSCTNENNEAYSS